MNMNFALGPTAATIIFCAARYTGVTDILNTRPLIALGEASYSIYFVHQIVLVTTERLSPAVHVLRNAVAKVASPTVD